MLVKQSQKKPHEGNHGGKGETHNAPTSPQEPQREAEPEESARTEINAREKFECRKRPEKTDDDRQRRRRRPRDAGGSGAAPFQNFPYVFVLFHTYDLFFMPYGPRLPCYRFCGLYFRGAECAQDFRTKKSAATSLLRLIFLSEPEGSRSWELSDLLSYLRPRKRKQGKRGAYRAKRGVGISETSQRHMRNFQIVYTHNTLDYKISFGVAFLDFEI